MASRHFLYLPSFGEISFSKPYETIEKRSILYGLTDFKALKMFSTNLLHAKSVPNIVINLVNPSVGNIADAGFSAVQIDSIISAP